MARTEELAADKVRVHVHRVGAADSRRHGLDDPSDRDRVMAGTQQRTVRGSDELAALVGQEVGLSDWFDVSQEAIDAFAEATGDDYWLHTDPSRAAQSPVGGTIAHGLLTLSLGPRFTYALLAFEGFSLRLNYGYEKVRFPAPVPVGSRVRMRSTLRDVKRLEGGSQATFVQTFEREGHDKPVCVAEHVVRFFD
jgi:acyl dehydratase